MKNETKVKVYPNHILEEELRKRGVDVRCMWVEKGPRDTGIAWHECLLVKGRIVLVQTFEGGRSWDAFTSNDDGDIEATVEDVIKRCNWKVKE